MAVDPEAFLNAAPNNSPAPDVHCESLSALNEGELKDLIQAIPAPVYVCDREGHIIFYNASAAEIWGTSPTPGSMKWCGAAQLYHPDGAPMSPDQCPLALTLRQNRPSVSRELIIERPDGQRHWVLA